MTDPTTWIAQFSPAVLARPLRPVLVPAHNEPEPSCDGIAVNPFILRRPDAWCCPRCGARLLAAADFVPTRDQSECECGGWFRHDQCILCDGPMPTGALPMSTGLAPARAMQLRRLVDLGLVERRAYTGMLGYTYALTADGRQITQEAARG